MNKSQFGISLMAILWHAHAQGGVTQAQAVPAAQQVQGSREATPQAASVVEVTASRDLGVRRMEVAGRVVVSGEELMRYGEANLVGSLKHIPGITVENVGGHPDIRLHGLGAGYTQILLDGKPVPPGFTFDAVPAELVDRVEVYRTATAEQSTQAVAGTVNIVLKHKARSQQRQIAIGLVSQRGKISPNFNFLFGEQLEDLNYTIPANFANNAINEVSSVYQVERRGSNQPVLSQEIAQTLIGHSRELNLSPSIMWKMPAEQTLALNNYISHVAVDAVNKENTTTSPGTVAEFASDTLRLNQNIDILNSDLNWTRKFGDSKTFENRLGLTYFHRAMTANFAGFAPGNNQVLDRQVAGDSTNKLLTLTGKWSDSIAAGHNIAIGWDGSYSQRDEHRVQVDTRTVGRAPWNIDEAYDARIGRLALFARDEWEVTPRLSSYLGLRWEQLTTRSDGSTLGAGVANKAQVWSPTLQILWKLPDSATDQVRLGLARTYRAPDTGDLIPRRYIANSNGPANPDNQGNPNLRPELSWGLVGAYEHYIGKLGLLSVSGSVRRIDGVLMRHLYQDTRWISIPVNNGQATTRGLEVELKLPLAEFFESGKAWTAKFNVARNWSTVDALPGPDNRLATQTPVTAGAEINYGSNDAPFSAGASFTFRHGGYVRTSMMEAVNASVQRGFDLFAVWKLGKQDRLRFTVGNINSGDRVNEAIYFNQGSVINRATLVHTPIRATVNLSHQF